MSHQFPKFQIFKVEFHFPERSLLAVLTPLSHVPFLGFLCHHFLKGHTVQVSFPNCFCLIHFSPQHLLSRNFFLEDYFGGSSFFSNGGTPKPLSKSSLLPPLSSLAGLCMEALGIFVKQKTCWWVHQHVPAEKVSFFHLTLIMPTTPILHQH